MREREQASDREQCRELWVEIWNSNKRQNLHWTPKWTLFVFAFFCYNTLSILILNICLHRNCSMLLLFSYFFLHLCFLRFASHTHTTFAYNLKYIACKKNTVKRGITVFFSTFFFLISLDFNANNFLFSRFLTFSLRLSEVSFKPKRTRFKMPLLNFYFAKIKQKRKANSTFISYLLLLIF